MARITLDITFPDSLNTEQVADLHYVVADCAHRVTDWSDGVTWSITQQHAGLATVTLPMSEVHRHAQAVPRG